MLSILLSPLRIERWCSKPAIKRSINSGCSILMSRGSGGSDLYVIYSESLFSTPPPSLTRRAYGQERSYSRRKLRILEALMSVPLNSLGTGWCRHTPQCLESTLCAVWSSAVYVSLQKYKLSQHFHFQICPHLEEPPLPLCPDQKEWLVSLVRNAFPDLPDKMELVS